jgi:hypothetical protein
MNFRARIRKLEKTSNVGGFCLCYVKPEYDVYVDLQSPTLEAYRLPDFCEDCKRPVDKSEIETSFEEYQAIVSERVRQAAETLAKFED